MTEGVGRRVLVLGVTGMLGHVLFRFLARSDGVAVAGTMRGTDLPAGLPVGLAAMVHPGVAAADEAALAAVIDRFRPHAVVNCIGVVKQRREAADAEAAIRINALLPHVVARLAGERGARTIQISTDCVFSGAAGRYREDSPPDCTDLYGRSKLLGEVTAGDAVTLRTSIIGPELDPANGVGLVSWFLRRRGATPGWRRAIFSGLPTVELARVIRDHVLPFPELRGLYHVSAAPISKHDLLALVRDAYDVDAELVPDDAVRIDRSLDSSRFRERTGYRPPPWPALVAAMRAFG